MEWFPHPFQVIDNLHMMWMGIWFHHHAVTNKCVGPPDVGSQLKSCTSQVKNKGCHYAVGEALVQHGMVLAFLFNLLKVFKTFICCGWAYGSISSCHYHQVCWSRGVKSSAEILHHWWASKDAIMQWQWVRLLSNIEWFPHPFSTYEKCLTTFTCYGWAYGSITMPLPPSVLAQMWAVC